MGFTTTDFLALLVSVTLLVYYAHVRRMKRSQLPPGPPQLPIIGNLLDMPTEYPWVKYREWGQQYQSDIIHVNVAGTCMIIINSLEVLIDLLEKRGALYSSRVRMVMAWELMGCDWSMGFMPYGDSWRSHRALFQKELHSNNVQKFRPQQIKATRNLLQNLLDAPELWEKHLRHQAAAVIMDITYGLDVKSEYDPFAEAAGNAITALNGALTNNFLVESFPSLKNIPSWFPGAGFKKKAESWKKVIQKMLTLPVQGVEEAIAEGTTKPSFYMSCLQNIDVSQDVELQKKKIQNTAANMYAAGADTTVSTMSSFILAMTKFPEVQAKAQAELDAVLGKGQIPTFNDQASLPYLTAVVKESLRYQQVAPLAIPHQLVKEDVYRGYTFPAGAVIIPNSWAILHDEKTYPDPFRFMPERFLTSDGKLNPTVQDPELAAFGYGRRICPGRHLALASVWNTTGAILATYSITKRIGADGELIDPPGTMSSGFVCYPEKFECDITPRSEEIRAAIMTL